MGPRLQVPGLRAFRANRRASTRYPSAPYVPGISPVSANTYFVTGTDTGVGKTRVSCALLAAARLRGLVAAGMKPVASSYIMSNNISVGFTAFAMGITGGLGTVYMMAFNGLMLGVVGMACWLAGMSVQFWSFVAPHGVLELPAIFIAGGAGFRIAQGLLRDLLHFLVDFVGDVL